MSDQNLGTIEVQTIGGPTALLKIGGLRLITDPTFDPAGSYDEPGRPSLYKTVGPAVAADDIGPLDVALVSHDEHPDNLDTSGRELLSRVKLVLTTKDGAKRLGGGARGLAPFERIDVDMPVGGQLGITAVPAQHGPAGSEPIIGPVVGFVLSGEGLPTVYVSGDNASVDVVRQIVERLGSVDVAILFVGGASVPPIFDGDYLTLSNDRAVDAARVLGARAIVPVHLDGWAHCSQDAASLADAFSAAGLREILKIVTPGDQIEL